MKIHAQKVFEVSSGSWCYQPMKTNIICIFFLYTQYFSAFERICCFQINEYNFLYFPSPTCTPFGVNTTWVERGGQ